MLILCQQKHDFQQKCLVKGKENQTVYNSTKNDSTRTVFLQMAGCGPAKPIMSRRARASMHGHGDLWSVPHEKARASMHRHGDLWSVPHEKAAPMPLKTYLAFSLPGAHLNSVPRAGFRLRAWPDSVPAELVILVCFGFLFRFCLSYPCSSSSFRFCPSASRRIQTFAFR